MLLFSCSGFFCGIGGTQNHAAVLLLSKAESAFWSIRQPYRLSNNPQHPGCYSLPHFGQQISIGWWEAVSLAQCGTSHCLAPPGWQRAVLNRYGWILANPIVLQKAVQPRGGRSAGKGVRRRGEGWPLGAESGAVPGGGGALCGRGRNHDLSIGCGSGPDPAPSNTHPPRGGGGGLGAKPGPR